MYKQKKNFSRIFFLLQPSEGTQLYLELIDDDSNVSNNTDELIDRREGTSGHQTRHD